MQRTRQNKKPTAILTSDWHLREDTPACWIGDFQKEQWESVKFISDLQKHYDCDVIHAGDLFDFWKPSPWLLSIAIEFLPKRFYTIYGQHDLPQHNWELRNKSGIHTLERAKAVIVLPGCHYGQIPEGYLDWFTPSRKVLVWHHMTYITKPFPGVTGGNAGGILRKYPEYDLIVTGDNHVSFTTEYEGKRLVNPGNLTRQVADQIDFQPRVALWYAEDNTIKWVNIPIEQGVISREHIDRKEQRDERIEAFISRLDGGWEVGLSFEQNLESFFQTNTIQEPVKQIVYNMIE